MIIGGVRKQRPNDVETGTWNSLISGRFLAKLGAVSPFDQPDPGALLELHRFSASHSGDIRELRQKSGYGHCRIQNIFCGPGRDLTRDGAQLAWTLAQASGQTI